MLCQKILQNPRDKYAKRKEKALKRILKISVSIGYYDRNQRHYEFDGIVCGLIVLGKKGFYRPFPNPSV